MARSVSLSDEAFRVLRSEKQQGESDSDVVIRLAAEARAKRKDPLAFLKFKARPLYDWETFDDFRERMRKADVKRFKELHGTPKGGD